MRLIVSIDPISPTDPQPPSLTVMVDPGQQGVTPESAKAAIEDLLGEMGLQGIPFKLVGKIESHITDATGKHVHVAIHDHA
jgi:hypothetical protein